MLAKARWWAVTLRLMSNHLNVGDWEWIYYSSLNLRMMIDE